MSSDGQSGSVGLVGLAFTRSDSTAFVTYRTWGSHAITVVPCDDQHLTAMLVADQVTGLE